MPPGPLGGLVSCGPWGGNRPGWHDGVPPGKRGPTWLPVWTWLLAARLSPTPAGRPLGTAGLRVPDGPPLTGPWEPPATRLCGPPGLAVAPPVLLTDEPPVCPWLLGAKLSPTGLAPPAIAGLREPDGLPPTRPRGPLATRLCDPEAEPPTRPATPVGWWCDPAASEVGLGLGEGPIWRRALLDEPCTRLRRLLLVPAPFMVLRRRR